jgi:predicted TPR repeat methyltransferase
MAETDGHNDSIREVAEAYDREAAATGWAGPELAFGMAAEYIRPGQSILDIGIGTGLGAAPFREAGLIVHGMDVSREMLDACRAKGFTELTLHDLTEAPYPYGAESVDHAICIGALQFFRDLSTVFEEVARLLRSGGVFAVVVGDRSEDEAPEFLVDAATTGTGRPATMYRHSAQQIDEWAKASGLLPLRSLPFTVFMDRDRTRGFPARCDLVRKANGTKSEA